MPIQNIDECNCPILHMQMDEVSRTPCGHRFEKAAIIQWIHHAGYRGPVCPCCRGPITLHGLVDDPEYAAEIRQFIARQDALELEAERLDAGIIEELAPARAAEQEAPRLTEQEIEAIVRAEMQRQIDDDALFAQRLQAEEDEADARREIEAVEVAEAAFQAEQEAARQEALEAARQEALEAARRQEVARQEAARLAAANPPVRPAALVQVAVPAPAPVQVAVPAPVAAPVQPAAGAPQPKISFARF